MIWLKVLVCVLEIQQNVLSKDFLIVIQNNHGYKNLPVIILTIQLLQIYQDGTRIINKLNEPNAEKSILKTLSQSTKPSGLVNTVTIIIFPILPELEQTQTMKSFHRIIKIKRKINGKIYYQLRKRKNLQKKIQIFSKNIKE